MTERFAKVAIATLASFSLAALQKSCAFWGRLLGQGRNFFEIPAKITGALPFSGFACWLHQAKPQRPGKACR